MNLMSSTLLTEDTGVPFDELQAEQIALYRAAWTAGRLGARAADLREPQRASRSSPTSTGCTSAIGRRETATDQVGYLDGMLARFGKSYIGEPDVIAAELSQRRRRPRGRHAAAHRAEPARRRVQRAAARDLRPAHRSR